MTAHTQAADLVLALYRLEARRKCLIPVGLLTVEAWKAAPHRWGLAGYELLHPNHNATVACLSAKTGPVRTGLIERPIPGIAAVRLSAAGRMEAARLIEAGYSERRRRA